MQNRRFQILNVATGKQNRRLPLQNVANNMLKVKFKLENVARSIYAKWKVPSLQCLCMQNERCQFEVLDIPCIGQVVTYYVCQHFG
jgi:hypothetical protein